MTLAFPVLAAAVAIGAPPALDPQHLPQLPARGFALDTRAGVLLETIRGRPLGTLRGLDLAPDKRVSHSLVMRSGRRLFTLDLHERRVRRFFEGPPPVPGCRLTDARIHRELWVCARTVWTASDGPPGSKRTLRTVARAPGKVGHWVWAGFAPRGPAVLAQWSAECEVPIAFLVSDRAMRPFGGRTMDSAPESMALGWLPSGSAVIYFPQGACSRTFRMPGIYSVSAGDNATLLIPTRRGELYGMWGG